MSLTGVTCVVLLSFESETSPVLPHCVLLFDGRPNKLILYECNNRRAQTYQIVLMFQI